MAGSLRVQGAIATLSGGTLTIPTGAIIDGDVNAQADISVGKLRHLHKAGTNFDLGITGTPGNREELVYVATSAGTIRAFSAMLNDTGTSVDIDFTLKKNGVSIMTADINITNADADREVVDGTLSSTSYVADDVFSIQIAITSSTGAQGPFAWVEFDEAA